MKNNFLLFILLIFLVACENTVRFDTGERNIADNGGSPETEIVVSTNVFPNQFLDGQQTVASINLSQIPLTNKIIYYQVVDESNQIAEDFFINHTGSLTIPMGQQSGNIFLTSIPNSLSSGEKLFSFKISSSASGPFEKVSDIKLLATSESSIVVDTVSISNLTNNGFANISNQANYMVDGVCSAIGGVVAVTISQGSSTASENVSCGAGGIWSATFDLSALAVEGTYVVRAVHSGPNIPSGAVRSLIRDVTLPTVAITAPASDSYIGLSNQGAFTLSGTCLDNNQGLLFSLSSSGGGSPVESLVLCAGGAYSNVVNISSLSDGTITALVSHTDLAGNQNTASRNFVKNTISPVIQVTTPTIADVANSLNFSNQTVEGTCNKVGGTITLSGDVDGVLSGTCDGSNFEINGVEITGTDGLKSVNATLTDEFGNIHLSMNFIMKATALPTAILNGKPGAVSNQESLNITVSGSLVSSYQYKIGSNSLDCSISTGYSTVTPITTAITDTLGADGPQKICVVAIDSYGNPQNFVDATEHSWVKNTTAPTIAITSPAVNSYVNSNNVTGFTVSGTCGINGTNNVKIQGSITTVYANCVDGEWSRSLNFSSADQGPVFILVSQEDPDTGNTGQASRLFIKDTVLPNIAITSPAVNAYINKSNRSSFTVSGTCNTHSATPNIVVSGGSSPVSVACSGTTWTANVTFPDETEEATRTITATITTVAGNERVANRNFRLDTINPTLAISTPSQNSYANISNNASFTLTGSCSEERASSIVVREGTTTLATVNCTTSSPNWEAIVNLSALTDGSKTLAVTHTDAAGNTFTSNLSLIKDTVAPNIGWISPLENRCTSPNSVNSFEVSGRCTDGDNQIAISSSQLGSTVNVACSSNEFSASLNILPTGLSNGDDFAIQIEQVDVAGNSSLETRSFRYIDSAPTIAFGGWDDVYAIGKKTYKDGNSSEAGVVRIKWKEWPAGNTCMPTAVKVYRSDIPNGSLSGTLVSSTPISGQVRTFQDTTLSESDFEKSWYYGLRAVIGEWEVDVVSPSEIAEVRVVAPPQNMALVHRWITNQEVCGLIGSTPDPENNYRCAFTGQGNVGGFLDMGNDLLVDRFTLGCNISASCGVSEDQMCVSSNFNDATNPAAGVGIQAPIGSVFYSNQSNACYYKTGASSNQWTATNSLNTSTQISELGLIATSEAHAPPLSTAHRDRFQIACNQQSIDLSHITPYADNSTNGVAQKRLMTQKEWRASAAWDREMSFPDVYPNLDDYLTYLENGTNRTGDPNLRVGKCNSNNNRHGSLTPAAREFLGGYEMAYQAFETGSKIATIECQSRYGIQDMAGQMWERVSDELNCDNNHGDTCYGVTSSLDGNTDMAGFLFNGVMGPGGQVPTDPVYTVEQWALQTGASGTTYFNPVLGLPLMDNTAGSAVAIADWTAANLFHGDYFYLNSTNGNAVRGLLVGGSWHNGSNSGRWASNWYFAPSNTNYNIGGRCALSVE